jgi:AcrR family transcriptional regulator
LPREYEDYQGTTVSTPPGQLPEGLRERKKAKTRFAIQEHALRLIREQGFEATTVEQIAEAAEISSSTFFRYFPSKDAVVLTDDYDPLITEAFRAQPAELGPVQALRRAYRETLMDLPEPEVAAARERTLLVMAEPELRGAFFENLMDSLTLLSEVVSERVGRPPDDVYVRSLAGAIIGVVISVFAQWSGRTDIDPFVLMDEGLAHLEDGFRAAPQ